MEAIIQTKFAALQGVMDERSRRLWAATEAQVIGRGGPSHISLNWRGRPLTSHDVVVNLIASTSTRKGLKIQAELDTGSYPTGINVSDEHVREIQMTQAAFHGEWNYTITPRRSQSSI